MWEEDTMEKDLMPNNPFQNDKLECNAYLLNIS